MKNGGLPVLFFISEASSRWMFQSEAAGYFNGKEVRALYHKLPDSIFESSLYLCFWDTFPKPFTPRPGVTIAEAKQLNIKR